MPGDCMFCQLLQSGNILKIFENEDFVAFLDINPRAKGHTILTPKTHYPTVTDLPDTAHASFTAAVKTVTRKLEQALGAAGVSYVMNDGGDVAGQRVPHVYLQIFPRYEDDENAGAPAGAVFQPVDIDESTLRDLAQQLADATVSTGSEPVETRETGEGEEVVVDSPGDKLREGTDHQRTKKEGESKELSQIQRVAEQARENTQQQEQEPGSSREQAQEPRQPEQPRQSHGGEPPVEKGSRFSTEEEFDEDYPELSDISVETGVDLGKYDPQDLEIVAQIQENYTLVDLREGNHQTSFTLDGITRERQVVEAIANYFKLDPELVAERIEFRTQDFDEESLDPLAGHSRYDPDHEHHSLGAGENTNSPHDRAEFI